MISHVLRNYLDVRPSNLSLGNPRHVMTVKPGQENDADKYLSSAVQSLYSHPITRQALEDLIPQAWDSLGCTSEAEAWARLNDQFYPDSKDKLERGEFGECVAYLVFEELFGAEVPAKKLWYGKTNSKMPVFGKDVLAYTKEDDGSVKDFYLIEVKTSISVGSFSSNINDLESTLADYGAPVWIKELDQIAKTANLSFFGGDVVTTSTLITFFKRWREVKHSCLIVVDSTAIPPQRYDPARPVYVGRLSVPAQGTGRRYVPVVVVAHPDLVEWAANIYKTGGICRV